MIEKLKEYQPNKQIGDYCYNHQALIGRGQFGSVYLGYKIKSKSELFGIKVIEKKRLSDSYLKQAVENEINILSQLKGEYTCGLIQCYVTGHHKYLILPLCDGGDLRYYLAKQGKLCEEEAKTKLTQIVLGMKELVSQGFIHRDLKPENILLDKGVCRIADLGFSKQISEKDLMQSSVGTPLYMSPQQLKGESYSNKCDIWSIGIIYYEMLFGQHPWKVNSHYDLALKSCSLPIKFPFNVPVSQLSQDFIKGCLDHREKHRFSWQQVFSHDLFKSVQNVNQIMFKQGLQRQQSTNFIDQQSIKLLIKLQTAINNDEEILLKVFSKYDSKKNEVLDINDFTNMIKRLDSSLTNQQSQDMFNQFDRDKDGTISYIEFKKYIIDNDYEDKGMCRILLNYKVEAILKKIKIRIKNRSGQIQNLFLQLDKDKSGKLDRNQIMILIKNFDSTFTEKDLDYLFELYDNDHSGTFDFDEFKKMLMDQNYDMAEVDVSPIKQDNSYNDTLYKINQIVKIKELDIDFFLQQFDENGDGFIDKLEFNKLIRAINSEIDQNNIDLLFNKLDLKKQGFILIQDVKNIFK